MKTIIFLSLLITSCCSSKKPDCLTGIETVLERQNELTKDQIIILVKDEASLCQMVGEK